MKKRLWLAVFTVAIGSGSGLFPSARAADDIADLKRRIEELERQQAESLELSMERRDTVSAFLKDQLSIGGFFETGMVGGVGPGMVTQFANSGNILGINLSATFAPSTRFVSQTVVGSSFMVLNPQSDPRATALGLPARREFGSFTFGALLAQGYFENDWSDEIHIQVGTGYLPFGYAFQQRELVLFARRGGPQLLRTTNLVSPFWSGAHLYGVFHGADNRWGFNLYSLTTLFAPKLPGFGLRTWRSGWSDHLTLGVSTQLGRNENSLYGVFGADLNIRWHPVAILAEWAYQAVDGSDPWSAYIEPSLTVFKESWLFYLHLDYAQSALNKTGVGAVTFPDPYQKWEYGGGINWLPTSFTRLRLGISWHDYVGDTAMLLGQDRDFVSFDLSAGVAF